MDVADLLAGLAILVGLVGIVVPVLPGTLLILVAVVVWAAEVGTSEAWAYAAAAVVVVAAGSVVKYAVPGRRLRESGVPARSIVLGGLLGLVGFFVVPVLGLLLGFVLGVYLAETQRVGRELAWPSTKAALRAVGLSVLIELASGLVAAVLFLVGALAT